jgi:hypothetical protein
MTLGMLIQEILAMLLGWLQTWLTTLLGTA